MTNTNIDYIEKFNEVWKKSQQLLGEQITPRILVGGKTGVGKSSVLNAMMGKDVYEIGVLPTTRKNDEHIWESLDGDIKVIDAPGFGEANEPQSSENKYEDNIKKLAQLEAHIFLLVLKCDDRALDLESKYLEKWKNDPILRELPVILVINQIDKMKPTRDWNPKELNLKVPITEKEKNIRYYIDYVASLENFSDYFYNSTKGHVVPISAGESFNDPYQYGIEELREKIYEALPESAKTLFARAAEIKKKEANRIIRNYSASCAGAVAVNFTPASDAFIIAPIQIAMIINLGKLYNLDITKSAASGIVTSLGLSLAGPVICQTIVSFIPVIKNLVGPPLAFGLTYSIGRAVSELFAQGKTMATKEELKDLAKKYGEEGRRAADEYIAN